MDSEEAATGKDESSSGSLKEGARRDEATGATEKGSPQGVHEPPAASAPPPGTEGSLSGCFEEKECRICYSPLDAESRGSGQLGCRHAFCQHCLSQMCRARSGDAGPAIQCPLCSRLTAVPDGGVDHLPVGGASNSNAQPATPLLPPAHAAEAAPQRPLSEQGGEDAALSPPPVAAAAAAAAAASSAEAGLRGLLRKILPWEWLAFCLLLAMLSSVAILGPTLWKLSPWLLFLALSLCCILPCGLVVGYREIRRRRRGATGCPTFFEVPFPGSCI